MLNFLVEYVKFSKLWIIGLKPRPFLVSPITNHVPFFLVCFLQNLFTRVSRGGVRFANIGSNDKRFFF